MALKYVDGVMTSDEFSAGDKWLARANKSHILLLLEREEESKQMRQSAIDEYKTLPPKEKAKVYMAKAFALNKLKNRANDDVMA